MASQSIIEHLDIYGPDLNSRVSVTPEEARAYCKRLAHNHYENFTVVSWLIPKRLRQHLCNIYAYCRWADDLADETGDKEKSLQLLGWWQRQLVDCYAGLADHPVFVALKETIEQFDIPQTPFQDLLTAFRQDQTTSRYQTLNELIGYCRNSANPVGRLVLFVGRSFDEENARLSDSICTGLQLANFCQDVARDFDKGRVYLPQDSCCRFGYEDSMFERREFTPAFHQLMIQEVDRAEEYLHAGKPLIDRVNKDLRVSIRTFISGGLAILAAIRRIDYDVWRQRPTVSRWTKLKLLASAWWRSKGFRS